MNLITWLLKWTFLSLFFQKDGSLDYMCHFIKNSSKLAKSLLTDSSHHSNYANSPEISSITCLGEDPNSMVTSICQRKWGCPFHWNHITSVQNSQYFTKGTPSHSSLSLFVFKLAHPLPPPSLFSHSSTLTVFHSHFIGIHIYTHTYIEVGLQGARSEAVYFLQLVENTPPR